MNKLELILEKIASLMERYPEQSEGLDKIYTFVEGMNIGCDLPESSPYNKGVEDGKRSEKFDFLNKASNWLMIHAGNYLIGEYNEFHHAVEYDGDYDADKLVKEFREEMLK